MHLTGEILTSFIVGSIFDVLRSAQRKIAYKYVDFLQWLEVCKMRSSREPVAKPDRWLSDVWAMVLLRQRREWSCTGTPQANGVSVGC